MKATEVDELVGARRMVRITRGFAYRDNRAGLEVVIEPGFLSDLGSIPALARSWLSPNDPWAQAYVVHDKLYELQIVSRKTADLILWDALGLPYRTYRNGVVRRVICPKLERAAIYSAVRVGGNYR